MNDFEASRCIYRELSKVGGAGEGGRERKTREEREERGERF